MVGTKQRIVVSPEMLSFVGRGTLPREGWPPRPVLLRFSGDQAPALTVEPAPGARADDGDDAAALVFVVAGSAVERLFGSRPDAGVWHLPSALRSLVLSITEPGVAPALGDTVRLARSIELLCAVLDHMGRDLLVPVAAEHSLSEGDVARIAAARRLIDEQWQGKLSLDSIARACGLNRGKLTRGFRSVYGCTVADALTHRRLDGARSLLAATDLPVATIGYRCGYRNNASFTRAFARHVGVAPTRWRATREIAA